MIKTFINDNLIDIIMIKDKYSKNSEQKKGESHLTKPPKWHLFIGIFQIFFSILMGMVALLLLLLFGGEFLIVDMVDWVLPVFAILLIGGSIYSFVMTILSRKSGRLRGFLLEKISNKKLRLVWLLFWSIWNIFVGILLIFIFRFLYFGTAGSLPEVLIFVLAIPFFGYTGIFFVSSFKFFLEKFWYKKDAQLIRGVTAAGIAFLIVFGIFGVILAFWNPQWTDGVQRQKLFVTGEQPGRGYRIPALITLPGDTMLAFCESRFEAMSDLGDIDIIMKRSIDGGETWGAIQVLQDRGQHTVHNPCPLFDNDTQTLWLPFCVDYDSVFIMNSTDLGVTWSEPRELTEEIAAEGLYCATGPGNGIQISNGRLIIPSSIGGACVIYSDDHGFTWVRGGYVGEGEEPQVFESSNGSLVINCRSGRGENRIMAWSNNGGGTWDSWYYEEDLPAAGTQASVHRFTNTSTHMRSRVLFSNPNYFSRGHLNIRMSYDEGLTWNVSKQVYDGPSAYSSITVLSDYTIIILFETGKYDYRESLTLIKVDLDWLTNGQDALVSV